MDSDKINISLLVERLHGDDVRAFEQLYGLFGPRIYGRLLKLTQCGDLADELLQNTFVKLWEHRRGIAVDGYLKSWLYKVAENEVYQFYRKVARDKRLQERIGLVFVEAYAHIEEDIFKKERGDLLEQAIGQLSPQRKEVFTLCRLEGRSYQEAADLLGISSSTVSNHLVKANSSVQQFLFRSKESMLILIAVCFLMV